jgi:2-polyprenyl-3-methyl-5-hydroxy-6-metoxy-1,4-benzoquinol methylase
MPNASTIKLGRRILKKLRALSGQLHPDAHVGVFSNAAPATRVFSADQLDDFVAKTDALGGPNSAACVEFWRGFQYRPTAQVDRSLDPYGELYYGQQIALYTEISGRALNQTSNEQFDFDVLPHILAANPYNHPDPAVVAQQIGTLTAVCRLAAVKRGALALDMGCGWGLSSETLAYCGLDVDAVDINQNFIDLVNGRAQRLSLPMRAFRSDFDSFRPPFGRKYSLALFYECFHHATKPWELMRAVVAWLEPSGKLVLASEPVQSTWWKSWGLRLDPLSIYCIRKYGWFESGWSEEFLHDMFSRNGLTFSVTEASAASDAIYIGTKSEPTGESTELIPASFSIKSHVDLAAAARESEWWIEDNFVVSKGNSAVEFAMPSDAKYLSILIMNFRPTPVSLSISMGASLKDYVIFPGPIEISFPCASLKHTQSVRFSADTWCPNDELKNGDTRRIAIHVAAIRFWNF